MTDRIDVIWDLVITRARLEDSERDLSTVVHLFYGTLVWITMPQLPALSEHVRMLIRMKILQLPQASSIGLKLIELDKQFGGLLETRGVELERWIFEPRGRHRTDSV